MPLRGDLGSIDLAHVFQLLTLNEEAGVLEIFADGVRTLVYFGPKGVQFPYDPKSFPEKVVRLMQRRSEVTPDQVSRARTSLRDARVDMLTALVHMRAVTEEQLARALREQTEEEIYELFVASDASFEFREGELPPPDRVLDERCVLSGNALILEAARRIDDWGYIRRLVPSDGEIYEPVADLATVAGQDRDAALDVVYQACDGVRTVSALVEETHLPRYAVCKKLAILVEQGIMVPVPPDVLLERANQCMHTQRLNDALCLYEKAIAGGCRDPALPEMAGLAYQSVLEYRQAAKQYAIVADRAEAAGNLKLAVEMHLRVRELLPTDIESRRKLLEIHGRAAELFTAYSYDALSETADVALILRELSRTDESLKLVRETTAKCLQDVPSALRLADLAIEIGDPRGAVDTLITLGDRLSERSDFDAALRIYRRVKAIDPQHPGVGDRLQRLQGQIGRRHRRQSRLKGGTLVVLLLLVGSGWYAHYAKQARTAYRQLPAEELVASGRYQAAIASYQRYRQEYLFTPWAFLAREKVADVRLAQRRHMDIEGDQAVRKLGEEQKAQQNAVRFAAEARRAILGSQPDQGLDLLRKARDLATDAAWLKQEDIDHQIVSLEDYFSGARLLRRQADGLLESGDVKTAHAALSDLAKQFPLAPEAKNLRLPVMVTSDPSGASVRLIDAREMSTERPNGIELATAATPALLEIPVKAGLQIEISMAGYLRERRELDPLTAAEVSVALRKSPLMTVPTAMPCAFVHVIDAERVLVGASDGRLQLRSVRDGSQVWQATFPAADELVPGAALAGAAVYLVGRGGMLVHVALADGSVSAPQRLSIAPSAAPVIVGKRLALAGDSRLLVLGLPEHESAFEKTFEVPIRGVLQADHQFLIWLANDRLVSLRALEGREEGSLELPHDTTVVRLTSTGSIACGTRDGEVSVLSRDGTRQWHARIGPGREVTELLDAQGGVIAVCRGVELVAFGPKGDRLGGYSDGQPLRVAQGDGPALMVGSGDARILRLQLPSLVLVDEFPVPGHLRGIPTGDRTRAFFGTEDGSLHIFQIPP